MEPDEFRQWRKSLGWKQKDAAERLGLKKRVIQYYEKGDRDGKAVSIPTSVQLACLALALGHERWDGAVAARAIEDRAKGGSPVDEPPVEAVAALDGGESDAGQDASERSGRNEGDAVSRGDETSHA